MRTSLLKNEIVSMNSEPTPIPLYGFLIYSSNANFKNCILPFISSSENLLKFFFHFQKLNPNVDLEKFLPYSRLKVTVLDGLQNSYVAYIFENQFNPILISTPISAPIYKTIDCSYIDETIDENSICALFSLNKIFVLKSYILPKNQEVFAARDESDDMFFVALKKTKEKLIGISHGKIEQNNIEFPDYLNVILDAHNLNVLSKLYFKWLDFWVKYNNGIRKNFLKARETCVGPLVKWICCFIWFPLTIGLIFYYHALMLPFHIFSIPLEFFLCEQNSNVGKMIKNFNQFWLFPYSFYFIFRLCFAPFDLHTKLNGIEIGSNDIEPQKTMFAVPYLIERKQYDIRKSAFMVCLELIALFYGGFFSSLPFVFLFSLHGEHNK